MNERIQELAEQAGYIDRGNNHTAYQTFNHEKFAELIIKECAKIAFQHDIAKFTRDGMKIGLEIEKHFGVE